MDAIMMDGRYLCNTKCFCSVGKLHEERKLFKSLTLILNSGCLVHYIAKTHFNHMSSESELGKDSRYTLASLSVTWFLSLNQ